MIERLRKLFLNDLPTGVSTFASRISPSTDQSLQKSFHLSHAEKIELEKISSPSENKKHTTAQTDTTEECSNNNGFQTRWTKSLLITAVLRPAVTPPACATPTAPARCWGAR